LLIYYLLGERMKLPNWFKVMWWILLLIILSVFLYKRYPQVTAGNSTTLDIFVFLIWVALCLLPLFEELSFFGITLKKEVEGLKADITNQINSLKADIKNTVNVQFHMPIEGQISPAEDERPPKRSDMEYKILNTLWTKQVNKFPEFSTLFTFVIFQNTPEYYQFREAGSKLIGEGLIGETQDGQYYLTHTGWDWCKDNYHGFPSDQWWPDVTINSENLKKVLENHKRKSSS
jgi:hypothetical protein